MKFSIEIAGSHTEGAEASVRFDKLGVAYIDSLRSAGFIVEETTASLDTAGKPSEVLRKKGLNQGPNTEPEPASWQAAVMSAAARGPAQAESNIVVVGNENTLSPAARRVADSRIAVTSAGDTKFDDSSTATATTTDAVVDESATDAELKKLDDPDLALDLSNMSAADVNKALKDNLYTVDELNKAISDEKAAKNRSLVVSALEAARDDRQKANEAVPA